MEGDEGGLGWLFFAALSPDEIDDDAGLGFLDADAVAERPGEAPPRDSWKRGGDLERALASK